MEAVATCPERERLLREAARAANHRARSAAKLSKVVDQCDRNAFEEACREAEESVLDYEQAWHAYRFHCAEHGC